MFEGEGVGSREGGMGKEGRGGFERQGLEGREKQYFSSGVQIDVVSLSVVMETVGRKQGREKREKYVNRGDRIEGGGTK